MAKNQLLIILTLLLILGLFGVAGAVVWLGLRMQPNSKLFPTAAQTSESRKQTDTQLSSMEQIALESDRNVDYSKLRDNLQRQDWKTADRETYERLLDAAGPVAQSQGFTPLDEMNTLSCKDLRTVDRLWSAASDGKYGFGAQQGILRALGDYRKMYEQVGWQKSSAEWLIEWTYNPQRKRMDYKPGKEPNFTNPPIGHLPTIERGYNFDVSFDAALKRCKF